jgi:hypothetical protein
VVLLSLRGNRIVFRASGRWRGSCDLRGRWRQAGAQAEHQGWVRKYGSCIRTCVGPASCTRRYKHAWAGVMAASQSPHWCVLCICPGCEALSVPRQLECVSEQEPVVAAPTAGACCQADAGYSGAYRPILGEQPNPHCAKAGEPWQQGGSACQRCCGVGGARGGLSYIAARMGMCVGSWWTGSTGTQATGA